MESYQEKENKILNALEFIGLGKNERIIYLDLLKHGASTASDISKRTRIHRPNTYDTLRKLIDKSFIFQVRTSDKNLFQAMEASKLHSYVEQKKKEVDEVIPYISDISKSGMPQENISIGEGSFAARSVALSLLDINKEIKVFGASQQAVDILGEGFLKEFHTMRIKKKIVMKHIYSSEAINRIKFLNKIKYTEARCLPKAYDTPVSTAICGDIVLLFVFSHPASVIKIRRKEIADAYDRYFSILWNKARL